MTSSIAESWARIEAWLVRHAPVTYANLAPPADPGSLAATEEVIGMTMPGPLAESLLLHDGTGLRTLLPSGWYLLSAEDIARTWSLRTEIAGSDADGIQDSTPSEFGPWWNRHWIPFASFGNGDDLVIDQFGRIGDASHETGCHFDAHPMWSSFPELFAHVAAALETGATLDRYEWVIDDGELDWEIL